MPAPLAATARDWLSLGPASRLLGVDPDTLRRWADEGRLPSYSTPGGHRRFKLEALERLIAARRPAAGRPLALIGATPERIARAYRRSYQAGIRAAAGPGTQLPAAEREAFREDGRHLVEALLRYVESRPGPKREAAEAQAAALVEQQAARLTTNGARFADAVGVFLAARRPLLSELGQLAARRALDPASLASLYGEVSALFDRLLLRLIQRLQPPVRS